MSKEDVVERNKFTKEIAPALWQYIEEMVEEIDKKILDTKEKIEDSKNKLQLEIDKMEKLEISDYSEENKKLLKDD